MIKHKPPAWQRYREKHPTLSVVLSKELKETLDRVRGKMSYKDIIVKLLNKNQDALKEAYVKGYTDARERYAFQRDCPSCGKKLYFPGADCSICEGREYLPYSTHVECSCGLKVKVN